MGHNSYRDFETKTSVHITLVRSTHAELRKILFDYKLSMQEVFREFTKLIVEEDKYVIKILDRLQKEKREKIPKKMVKSDAESLFRAIENSNIFSQKE